MTHPIDQGAEELPYVESPGRAVAGHNPKFRGCLFEFCGEGRSPVERILATARDEFLTEYRYDQAVMRMRSVGLAMMALVAAAPASAETPFDRSVHDIPQERFQAAHPEIATWMAAPRPTEVLTGPTVVTHHEPDRSFALPSLEGSGVTADEIALQWSCKTRGEAEQVSCDVESRWENRARISSTGGGMTEIVHDHSAGSYSVFQRQGLGQLLYDRDQAGLKMYGTLATSEDIDRASLDERAWKLQTEGVEQRDAMASAILEGNCEVYARLCDQALGFLQASARLDGRAAVETTLPGQPRVFEGR